MLQPHIQHTLTHSGTVKQLAKDSFLLINLNISAIELLVCNVFYIDIFCLLICS